MKPSRLVRALGACLIALPLLLSIRAASAADSPSPVASGKGAMLPDTAVLARVENRVITVFDVRDRYFASDALTRSKPDSAGRVEFLNTMIGKDVLGLTARSLNRPLSYEDRLRLQEMTNSALARTFYDHEIMNRVVITEAEIQKVHPQFGVELRLRNIVLHDRALAEKVRDDLVKGRTTWTAALKKNMIVPDSLVDRDFGWMARGQIEPYIAIQVFDLKPNEISPVIATDAGFTIWQCRDRRATLLPPLAAVRRTIMFELREQKSGPLREKFFAMIRERAQAHYDTTNILWLSDLFRKANPSLTTSGQTTIDLRNQAPRIAPADTNRVLATTRRGRFTVDRFMTIYKSVPSLLRARVGTLQDLMNVLERMVLEPDIVDVARERGIDQLPDVVTFVEQRREAMMVESLYDDSVLVHVHVTDAQRKKYYQDHKDEFVTRERVLYAMIPRTTERGADSVIARLKAGEPAAAILAADSIAGAPRGIIRATTRGDVDQYTMYLFEELKPGESMKIGGNKATVLHVIDHEYTRTMSYAEVQTLVDESVQNIEAERQLAALVKRLSKRYKIESHPELVMRFPLTDPLAEWGTAPSN